MSRPARLQAAALLLAAWLGASLITVAVVAPGAFDVLPSRTIAGAMVGRVLPSLFVAGVVIGLAVAAVMALSGVSRRVSLAALVAAVSCGVSQFVITPKLDRLRAEIAGPVDVLPPGDARRVAFGVLHGYNVAGLGTAMIAAAVCLWFLLLALRPRN